MGGKPMGEEHLQKCGAGFDYHFILGPFFFGNVHHPPRRFTLHYIGGPKSKTSIYLKSVQSIKNNNS